MSRRAAPRSTWPVDSPPCTRLWPSIPMRPGAPGRSRWRRAGGWPAARTAHGVAQVVREMLLDPLREETDERVPTRERPPAGGNEPADQPHIVQRIADLRGCAPEEIAAATAANARRVYAVN